jgi:ABC-type sugar transport system substrate-binding protein
MRVAFLNLLSPQNPWRREVLAVMHAAAHDLGIELVEYSTGYWPGEHLALLQQVLSSPRKPDYLLISMHRSIGVRILELAEQAHVPVFVINTGLTPEEQARFGGPRQHFKSWLGQMVPDDVQAGDQLAQLLIDAAHRLPPSSPGARTKLVALEGRRYDSSARQRNEGLRKALDEHGEVEFLQGVPAFWLPEPAHRKTSLLLRRYPDIQVVWAANDVMALGALRALEEAGRHPGEDVVVGGIDWAPQALQAVREGKMVTSLGGHFLEGGWALVLLYDYHQGQDFASERVDWRTKLVAVTRDNVDDYRRLIDSNWEEIDFRAFSKAANPALKRYDFSLQALFEQR